MRPSRFIVSIPLIAGMALLTGCGGASLNAFDLPGGGIDDRGPISREVSLYKLRGLTTTTWELSQDNNVFPKAPADKGVLRPGAGTKPKLGSKVFWENDINGSEFAPMPGAKVGDSFDLQEGYFAIIRKIERALPGDFSEVVNYSYDIFWRGGGSNRVGATTIVHDTTSLGEARTTFDRVITGGPKPGSYFWESIYNDNRQLLRETIRLRYQESFGGQNFSNFVDYSLRPGALQDRNIVLITENVNGISSRLEGQAFDDGKFIARYTDTLGYVVNYEFISSEATWRIDNPRDAQTPAIATMSLGSDGLFTFADRSTKRFRTWDTNFWLSP